jgi:asparagine synthase (glutamine-hydrolysing)
MSGIVGILSDDRPLDADLLRRLTASLAFRGPDAESVWIDDGVGFGHAALRTREACGVLDVPATLDGRVWITADARIDARAELVARLASRGQRGVESADDNRLILHAYLEWGERCVDYLLGDFAFAIWDGIRRQLFCARDHFGVKPFYYAETNEGFVFSNTLDCVRAHPAVDGALNDLAVADFLLFGQNLENTTTTFAQIKRLPPAHTLVRGTNLLVRRYWRIPTGDRIRYSRSSDYVEGFREVFEAAVADRVDARRIGIWMSGGLDSTSIAATARHVVSQRSPTADVIAHTIVYDRLIPDEEREFARLAAQGLNLSTRVFAADDYKPFDGWGDLSTPEPVDDTFLLMRHAQLTDVAASSRVLLCGEGGDELLWSSYLVDLLGRMSPVEWLRGAFTSGVLHRRRPGIGLRRWFRRRMGPEASPPPLPSWIDRTLADRHGLAARWRAWHALEPTDEHPLRPEAHGRLAIAPWAWYFEAFDPGVTRVPVEVRYPFLDLRVVNYLLALPPLPWCVDKHLLRVAMEGRLPDAVRQRTKRPLAGDPLHAHLRQAGSGRFDGFEASAELATFVDRAAIAPVHASPSADDTLLRLRPYCLDRWLRRTHAGRGVLVKETSHGVRTLVDAT